MLGDHDARTGGNTDKDGQQQIQNRHGSADSSQRVVTHIFADHDGVHCVVELLCQIAQQHGDGKFGDALPGRTFRHIPDGEERLKTHENNPFLKQNRGENDPPFLRNPMIHIIVRHFGGTINRIGKENWLSAMNENIRLHRLEIR